TRWTPGRKTERAAFAARLQHIVFSKKTGAGEGIRTLDPNLGKIAGGPFRDFARARDSTLIYLNNNWNIL
ncbi:hypothetical protein QH494_28695, partial [Sphingomonas sp. AR_OL41]|uniref:hypothetical protein n=1 Tax=Sphingomonas sp. AR_OL41 TaxID=3042729 RepID=UPI00248143C4